MLKDEVTPAVGLVDRVQVRLLEDVLGALRRGSEPSLLKRPTYGSCSAGVFGSHHAFR
jgi:hypothetical protein